MLKTARNMVWNSMLASTLLLVACRTTERPSAMQQVQQEKTGIYLTLQIRKENLPKKAGFFLEKISAFDKDESHLVKEYYPGESLYVLETYDAKNRLMDQYALDAVHYIITEDFSGNRPKSEIIPLKENILESVIPYNPGINTIKINHGTQTTFSVGLQKRTYRLEERLKKNRSDKLEEVRKKYPHITTTNWNLEQMGLKPIELYLKEKKK